MLIPGGFRLSQPCRGFLTKLRALFTEEKKVIAVSLDCMGDLDCVGFDAASDALITKGVPRAGVSKLFAGRATCGEMNICEGLHCRFVLFSP